MRGFGELAPRMPAKLAAGFACRRALPSAGFASLLVEEIDNLLIFLTNNYKFTKVNLEGYALDFLRKCSFLSIFVHKLKLCLNVKRGFAPVVFNIIQVCEARLRLDQASLELGFAQFILK